MSEGKVIGKVDLESLGISHSTHLVNVRANGDVVATEKTDEMYKRIAKTRAEKAKRDKERQAKKVKREAEKQARMAERARVKAEREAKKRKKAELRAQLALLK